VYWQDEEKHDVFTIPDNVVDLSFKIDCRQLKLDHAWALSTAVCELLPWFENEPQAAIHHVYISQSGNGWNRADEGGKDVLQLSRRTRLKIRVPQSRKTDTLALTGKTINVDGNELSFGKSETFLLSAITTIVSRHAYIAETEHDEKLFLHAVNAELQQTGIKARKMLCGKSHQLKTPQGLIKTRSLMLADLSPEDSIRLQENGIGRYYTYGCGIFIPQKGITAVNSND
jgi:CRISPR-associated protein Cas6